MLFRRKKIALAGRPNWTFRRCLPTYFTKGVIAHISLPFYFCLPLPCPIRTSYLMPNIAEVRRRVVLTKCNFVRANIMLNWVPYCARYKASQAKHANKFGLIYSLLQPLSPSPTWRMRAERETWKRGATYSGRGKTLCFTESWRARQNSFFILFCRKSDPSAAAAAAAAPEDGGATRSQRSEKYLFR